MSCRQGPAKTLLREHVAHHVLLMIRRREKTTLESDSKAYHHILLYMRFPLAFLFVCLCLVACNHKESSSLQEERRRHQHGHLLCAGWMCVFFTLPTTQIGVERWEDHTFKHHTYTENDTFSVLINLMICLDSTYLAAFRYASLATFFLYTCDYSQPITLLFSYSSPSNPRGQRRSLGSCSFLTQQTLVPGISQTSYHTAAVVSYMVCVFSLGVFLSSSDWSLSCHHGLHYAS